MTQLPNGYAANRGVPHEEEKPPGEGGFSGKEERRRGRKTYLWGLREVVRYSKYRRFTRPRNPSNE